MLSHWQLHPSPIVTCRRVTSGLVSVRSSVRQNRLSSSALYHNRKRRSPTLVCAKSNRWRDARFKRSPNMDSFRKWCKVPDTRHICKAQADATAELPPPVEYSVPWVQVQAGRLLDTALWVVSRSVLALAALLAAGFLLALIPASLPSAASHLAPLVAVAGACVSWGNTLALLALAISAATACVSGAVYAVLATTTYAKLTRQRNEEKILKGPSVKVAQQEEKNLGFTKEEASRLVSEAVKEVRRENAAQTSSLVSESVGRALKELEAEMVSMVQEQTKQLQSQLTQTSTEAAKQSATETLETLMLELQSQARSLSQEVAAETAERVAGNIVTLATAAQDRVDQQQTQPAPPPSLPPGPSSSMDDLDDLVLEDDDTTIDEEELSKLVASLVARAPDTMDQGDEDEEYVEEKEDSEKSTEAVQEEDEEEEEEEETEETEEEPEDEGPVVAVKIRVGSKSIPAPGRKDNKSEDAFFISKSVMDTTFGVFDGVGGWSSDGVDAGDYSRELAKQAQLARENHGVMDPGDLMQIAHDRTKVLGSCTACLCHVDHTTGLTRIANLGDSGVMLVRGGAVVQATPPLQHSFNFPYQLGCSDLGAVTDLPEDADQFKVTLAPGDVFLLATDGIFDNCYAEEIAEIVTEFNINPESNMDELADALAQRALEHAEDPLYVSPFAKAASANAMSAEKKDAQWLGSLVNKNKTKFVGGKKDDITLIICSIEE